MKARSRCATSTMSACSSAPWGRAAFIRSAVAAVLSRDLFRVLHVLIGLTALIGAIILVTLTVVTEFMSRARRARPLDWRRAATTWPPPAGVTPRCWWPWACPDAWAGALERGQPGSLPLGQSARQRRHRRSWRHRQGAAHDPAVGGARRRRLHRDPPRKRPPASSSPARSCARGAGAGRPGDKAHWRGFVAARPELASPQPAARINARAHRADAVAAIR